MAARGTPPRLPSESGGAPIEKDPDILVDLTDAKNDFDAQVIVEALRAQGIPAQAFTTAASTLQWEVAASHPYRVTVRRADLQRAKDALRAIRADSVDLDWDEINTGDKVPEDDSGAKGWARSARWIVIGVVAAAAIAVIGYLIQLGVLNPSPPH